MIKIESLSKKYGRKKVLSCVNLILEKGKVYGIVGENGAGKTTLFKCLTGLEAFEGKIDSSYKPLKDHIGYLPTEAFFFSKITGGEYIQFFANSRAIKLDNIHEKNIFGLPLHQYASTYSTGMKKKLALTAILVQQNDVYILDEPFNGVDIQSNMIITELILKLKQYGKTIVLSSHMYNTLSMICDEIHLLENGSITKTVLKKDFNLLEEELKNSTISNRVDQLFKKETS